MFLNAPDCLIYRILYQYQYTRNKFSIGIGIGINQYEKRTEKWYQCIPNKNCCIQTLVQNRTSGTSNLQICQQPSFYNANVTAFELQMFSDATSKGVFVALHIHANLHKCIEAMSALHQLAMATADDRRCYFSREQHDSSARG